MHCAYETKYHTIFQDTLKHISKVIEKLRSIKYKMIEEKRQLRDRF